MLHTKKGFAFYYIATYWINILRFLNNDSNGTVYESPHDIPRIKTHYRSSRRNVSVYSDEPGPSELSNKLSYISRDKFLQEPSLLNEHWAPYKYLCDPCVFRPHAIGKMETFRADTSAILEAVNWTWVLDAPSRLRDNDSHKDGPIDRSVLEMSMLTYYNMKILTFLSSLFNTTDENCFNQLIVNKRLWAAFQYNGHLPFNVQFPEQLETGASIAPEDFLKICKETFYSWNKYKKLLADHKKAAMIEAYRTVPNDVMNRLLELYESTLRYLSIIGSQ